MIWKKKDSPRTTVDGAAKSRKPAGDTPHPDNLQEYLDGACQLSQCTAKHEYIHTFPVRESASRAAILRVLGKSHTRAESRDTQQVHVGAAGFFNLDMIAKSRADAAVFIDYNPNQIKFWKGEGEYKGFITMLRDCETREALHEALRPENRSKYLNPDWPTNTGWEYSAITKQMEPIPSTMGAMATSQLVKECGVLADEGDTESYQHLHQLAKTGRLAAIQIDITKAADCEALHNAIAGYKPQQETSQKPFGVHTVYSSNILELLTPPWSGNTINGLLARAERAGREHSPQGREANIRDAVEDFINATRSQKCPDRIIDVISKAATVALAGRLRTYDEDVEAGRIAVPLDSMVGIPYVPNEVVQEFQNLLTFGDKTRGLAPLSTDSLCAAGLRSVMGSGFNNDGLIVDDTLRTNGVDALAGAKGTIYMGQTATHAPAIIRKSGQQQPAYDQKASGSAIG